MEATAVMMRAPGELELGRLALEAKGEHLVLVDIEYSGISTGTERLLWNGQMPPFPGMGYPLVPGYESVGTVLEAPPKSGFVSGDRVFVPGANCFGEVRGLFGGAASRLLVPAARLYRVAALNDDEGALLSLAATAQHAIASGDGLPPELIVGHGVLGRLLARLSVAMGGAPVVWEKNPVRMGGAEGYRVMDPSEDERWDYRSVYDVSGDGSLLNTLISRLGKGGEVVLAGFYAEPLSFAFPPAFMKEARLRIAAEFLPQDVVDVIERIERGSLSLGGLITHRFPFDRAADAYRTAFGDPACLKMLLDWRTCR